MRPSIIDTVRALLERGERAGPTGQQSGALKRRVVRTAEQV